MPVLEVREVGALNSDTPLLGSPSSLALTAPATRQTGDLLISVFMVYAVNTGSTTEQSTFTYPTGWTTRVFDGDNVGGAGGRTDLWMFVFTRTADVSSSDNATLSWTPPATYGVSDTLYAAGLIFAFNDTETYPFVDVDSRTGEANTDDPTTAYSVPSASIGGGVSFVVARQNDTLTLDVANSHSIIHSEEDIEGSILQFAATSVSTSGASTAAPQWGLQVSTIRWVGAMLTFGYNPQNLFPQVIFI